MKLVFMGTPDFSVSTLAALIEAGHEVACVYSQPPRPAGRGKADRPSPVQKFAEEKGIEVRCPVSLKDPVEQQLFSDIEADAAIVVAYGLILPIAILDAPAHGCFNVHASLLPRWRGAAPIQRAIMAGDAETGVCIMQMDVGLDTGDVVLSDRMKIDGQSTAGSLQDDLAVIGAKLMTKALSQLEAGSLTATKQPDEGVTYASKIDKAEARIDWTRPAPELDCHIRGLAPFPGAWFLCEGERIKILGCTPVENGGIAGKVLEAPLTVACGKGALQLDLVQRGGRKAMSSADLLRGFPVPVGAELTL
ncbi:MAG: methionyl-tRNA formyltransferase [Alphaproteobacteria bacterium]|jgi:methionyl-tRNA formyltransferase|nr:methionyl-tRNA formyltransferase [Alphaproteobacteria bacterium]MBT4084522.1 methionyl-tRNA formyltransferase [Alphaproteobacteria bacterium]MBT4545392.1 methionyl-tRNA formyltransferase [Alphaproteobacteria bacterium]MBT7745586.1 methionyl-tRNA formyltransferase [Alphaproteobacteria bacterium]